MGFAILLAFIAIPLLEIAVFIEVGGFIGLWWTLVVVVGTAFAGTYMLRRQGLATLRRAQDNMAEGRMPLREVFDGLCLLIAGALLLAPGFVTDLAGALLLMPPARLLLGQLVARHIVASGQFQSALNFILAQHRLVEPLYQLEKGKKLSVETPAAGRAFMEEQLLKGSQMLGDLWFTAWKEAPPDRYLQSYLAKRKLEKK